MTNKEERTKKLEAVVDAALGVVSGTKTDRPVSLSTRSLLALSEALDALDEPDEEKPLKDLYGANVEWGGGAKCVLCGSPMPDNEIRCRRCHP